MPSILHTKDTTCAWTASHYSASLSLLSPYRWWCRCLTCLLFLLQHQRKYKATSEEEEETKWCDVDTNVSPLSSSFSRANINVSPLCLLFFRIIDVRIDIRRSTTTLLLLTITTTITHNVIIHHYHWNYLSAHRFSIIHVHVCCIFRR